MTTEQIKTLAFVMALTVCLHVGWRIGARLMGME